MPNRRELGYVSSGASGSVPANTYGVATGGTSSSITVSGQNYTLLTFTSDGTLTVTKSGLFDVLLVGGGGGAGGDGTYAGGGGGGGGVSSTASVQTIYLDANQSIDVGAGGAGSSTSTGANGLESKIGNLFVMPAGGGGGSATGYQQRGRDGASGGGSYGINLTSIYKAQTVAATLGNDGGTSDTPGVEAYGGGGGAASAGGSVSSTTGGAGGNGRDISGFISGATYYAGAGGGSGGSSAGGAAGNGGVAGKSSGAGNNGVNYGAGGGGTYGASTGGSGAAGVVYVRFKI